MECFKRLCHVLAAVLRSVSLVMRCYCHCYCSSMVTRLDCHAAETTAQIMMCLKHKVLRVCSQCAPNREMTHSSLTGGPRLHIRLHGRLARSIAPKATFGHITCKKVPTPKLKNPPQGPNMAVRAAVLLTVSAARPVH
jgi:hypothetical protein